MFVSHLFRIVLVVVVSLFLNLSFYAFLNSGKPAGFLLDICVLLFGTLEYITVPFLPRERSCRFNNCLHGIPSVNRASASFRHIIYHKLLGVALVSIAFVYVLLWQVLT